MALLSDTLGLSALVTALNHRKPRGCTEASVSSWAPAHHAATDDAGELCFVRGVVQALDGTPIAGAEVSHGHAGDDAGRDRWFTGPDGAFLLKTRVAGPQPITHGGRPAHLSFIISAPGYERLVTHIFRQGDPFLDADAAFGVRGSLIADWVRHERGRTPDGHTSDRPFTTLDFAFVLNATTGDKP
jgi:hydroxyquinol 1,2-dioxygenase